MAKIGRPTKYKPEYCEAILKYFNIPATVEKIKKITTKAGTPSQLDKVSIVEEPFEAPNKLPTIEGFANHLKTTKQTVIAWTKDHPDFLDAYTRAKQFEQDILVENGLKGLYPSNFAIFVATNFTDMKDKQQRDVNLNVQGSIAAAINAMDALKAEKDGK